VGDRPRSSRALARVASHGGAALLYRAHARIMDRVYGGGRGVALHERRVGARHVASKGARCEPARHVRSLQARGLALRSDQDGADASHLVQQGAFGQGASLVSFRRAPRLVARVLLAARSLRVAKRPHSRDRASFAPPPPFSGSRLWLPPSHASSE
jgi:hypothetical protein